MNQATASVKLGRQRDKQIVDLISEAGPFTREQIQQLIFPHHKGPQKCSQRLTKLTQRGKLNRVRYGRDEQYIYYVGRWNQRAEHTLVVNWVYTSLLAQRKSWYKIQAFTREYTCTWDGGRLIADALLVLANTANKTLRPVLIEADRDTGNPFDKIPRYTEYYRSNAWCASWWAQKDGEGYHTFPRLLVVTERKERVLRAVEKDNAEGLRVAVATLEEVKKDLYRLL